MNVFVLSTGRCGSLTFARACGHLTNFTSGHETLWGAVGPARLQYPPNHIEVDNRLSWLLGRLDEHYGDNACYVHLTRDREQTAASYDRRWRNRVSLMRAYSSSILTRDEGDIEDCLDAVDTINSNIRLFLKDKSKTLAFPLENAHALFPEFCALIGAEGDVGAAVAEWNHKQNPTPRPKRGMQYYVKRMPRAYRKIARGMRGLPQFFRDA